MKREIDKKLDKRIQSLDLVEVSFFLSDFGGGMKWNRATTKRVEKFYRQSLYISITADTFRAVPSDAIDAFWHAHLLMTKKYAADCKFICGRFLHHDPLFGTRNNAEKVYYNQCKVRTLDEFKSCFGTTIKMLAKTAS